MKVTDGMISDVLEALADPDPDINADGDVMRRGAKINRVQSFEAGGFLTGNKGFVIYCEDGSEFQVSVVQSR